MQKDRERYEKTGIDGALLKNTIFLVLQACTYSLTAVSPNYEGRCLCRVVFGFGYVFLLDEDSAYAMIV